jgi:hypothetical protein
MRPNPIFLANVNQQGRIVFDEPSTFQNYLKTKAGRKIEVLVRPMRNKRSLQQNAYWWAVPVEIMAEYMGEERTATHYALLGECFGYHWNSQLNRDVPNKGSSSALTVEEFSALIEWCPPWALEHFDVHIPLPNECDYKV